MAEATAKEREPIKVLALKPQAGEMIKPAETVDIVGTELLSLYDRQVFNRLLANAHGPEMALPGREFTISTVDLRGAHNSNERLSDTIEKLMMTVVRYQRGSVVRRFQLLGGNDMADSSRQHGYLTYSFDKRLIELVQDSTTFAKLRLEVISAFSSKYALALYEYGARRINLKNRWTEEHTVDELREILGVPDGILVAFGNLKQKALDPALLQVNALADFNMWITAKRTGKRITHVMIGWHLKSAADRQAATDELQKSRIGRKARMKGTTEIVVNELKPIELPLLDPEFIKKMRA